MTLIASLGVVAGVFLLVPEGLVVTAVLWGVAQSQLQFTEAKVN